MSLWLKRNARPIGLVLLAAVVVIAGFELLDALADPAPAAEEEAEEFEGLASVAGLIKVMLFLGVGVVLAVPVRRWARRDDEADSEVDS